MALGCLSKFAIVVALLAVAGRLFVMHAIDEARTFGSGVCVCVHASAVFAAPLRLASARNDFVDQNSLRSLCQFFVCFFRFISPRH